MSEWQKGVRLVDLPPDGNCVNEGDDIQSKCIQNPPNDCEKDIEAHEQAFWCKIAIILVCSRAQQDDVLHYLCASKCLTQPALSLVRNSKEQITRRTLVCSSVLFTCVPTPAMRPMASSHAHIHEAKGPYFDPAKCAAQKYRDPVV